MSEQFVALLADSLPAEVQILLREQIENLTTGDFASLLRGDYGRLLFGTKDTADTQEVRLNGFKCWTDYLFRRLNIILSSQPKDPAHVPAYLRSSFFLIGYAALLSFLQSNFTGPPLPFSSAKLLFGAEIANDAKHLADIRLELVQSLAVDGVAAYRLTPNVELLCLADTIFTCPAIRKNVPLAAWAQLRTCFIHQRVLSEPAPTLQEQIYGLVDSVKDSFDESTVNKDVRAAFSLEKASIETYYTNDRLAREDIDHAARERKFLFAITGRLGKRTKWQEKDTSQLVVLAKSHETVEATAYQDGSSTTNSTAPENLNLNDDTLLESISFTTLKGTDPARVLDESSLPPALLSLDPASQPLLDPLDSIILLALASAITNTSPADGLTREETLPYATRVLEGGSSNWQIYTQALLVRSRIEGYKSRTIERGLLQLQALVDQVNLDTVSDTSPETNTTTTQASVPDTEDPARGGDKQTSFLPRPTASDAAPVADRLRYVFALSPPPRWTLESELAQRWVTLGGLRSALEIYERLEMWAEVALCYAATEREERARATVRKLLFEGTGEEDAEGRKKEAFDGPEKADLPGDAPRLFCILGDIDGDPDMYRRAWEVSHGRYARAQRSLARLFYQRGDHLRAAEAYGRSLTVSRLDHASWFALGCALLELQEWGRAVEAFTRCVQLDERDAEGWSNLAAAMLRVHDGERAGEEERKGGDGDEAVDGIGGRKADPQKNKRDALRALKRAASLKHDSHRIWENVLVVATSLDPPELSSAIAAQARIIDLRGKTDGEKCVDAEILAVIVREVMAQGENYDPSRPGPERMLVELVEKKVQPLITGSYALWRLVGRLCLWRKKYGSALEASEKAWRVVSGQPGWEAEERRWNEVVEATVELCEAYESLGPRERTEGLGAGDGAVVAKDWRFKARSAVRSVMGRGKATWDGSEGWEKLKEAMDGLKA
ncbi:hypothetical protein CAC42_3342 [Sphaceloma murrayae]|uniref:Uncharacterized protein n=1 Tax=Sphaceloma murrayae TaxID=2082308 RepID=A0A2K1R138_9PEZI|nr:hypothetical protein CAC42_3342 [Sphaceloma murrayae]